VARGTESKDTLIIQLTRLGDYCQTVPLIRDVKHQLADVHRGRGRIALVCDAEIAEIVERDVDEVIPLPLRYMLQRRRAGVLPLTEQLQESERMLLPLRYREWQRVFNLNIEPLAGLIAGVARAADKQGWSTGESPATGSRSRLVNCLWSISGQRAGYNLLLTDLYRKQCGETGITAPAAEQRRSGTIILHPGTGEQSRRLPLHFWAETARSLAHAAEVDSVLLTGTEAEKSNCERIAQLAGNGVVSLAGQTDYTDLHRLFREAALLVAIDTGVLHLGAVAGVPLVGLYPGSAGWGETAPFQEGALVVAAARECYPCREGKPTCGSWECFADFQGKPMASICLAQLENRADTWADLVERCRRQRLRMLRLESRAGWLTGTDPVTGADALTLPALLLRALYSGSSDPLTESLTADPGAFTAADLRTLDRLRFGLEEGIRELKEDAGRGRLARTALPQMRDLGNEWSGVIRFLSAELLGSDTGPEGLNRLRTHREMLTGMRTGGERPTVRSEREREMVPV